MQEGPFLQRLCEIDTDVSIEACDVDTEMFVDACEEMNFEFYQQNTKEESLSNNYNGES